MKNSSLNNKITLQNILFIAFMVILTVLLYMRDIGGVETNKFVLLGIVVGWAAISDYSHLMMLTMFVLPLTNGLPGNYIMPILCVLLLIKGGTNVKTSRIVWLSFVLFTVSELLHILLFSLTFDAPSFVGYISFLFLLFYIGGSSSVLSNESHYALSFCIGSLVMLGIILMNFQNHVGSELSEGVVRMGNITSITGEESMTLRTNPNNIGLYSIATISIAFALWYYKKLPLWVLVVIVLPAFLAGVYSLSRTWILSIVVFGVLFFIMRRGNRNSFFSVLIILLFAVGIYYFFTRLNVSLFESFGNRFESDEGTAGARTTLFVEYHKWMFDRVWALLFGTGAIPYKEVTQIFNSSHNALQQIFIAYGIPGLAFFIYLLYRFIKKWHHPKERQVYIPILIISLFLQSSQFLNPIYCAFPFIASLFVIKMLGREVINRYQ